MRFVLGVAIGFGVGFAGALLFAPDRSKRREVAWPAGTTEEVRPPAFEEDHGVMDSVKRALRSVREQVSEAKEAAKRAQTEAEAELRARYEREVRREVGELDAEKGKAKEKKSK